MRAGGRRERERINVGLTTLEWSDVFGVVAIKYQILRHLHSTCVKAPSSDKVHLVSLLQMCGVCDDDDGGYAKTHIER